MQVKKNHLRKIILGIARCLQDRSERERKYRLRLPQWLGAADHKQDALTELEKGISELEYSVGNVLFNLNGMGNSLGFGLWEEGSFIQVLTPQKIDPRKALRL